MPLVQPRQHPDYEACANAIGTRIAELLSLDPGAFWATRDGLALPMSAVREHILTAGREAVDPASAAAAMARCGWCLRVTWAAWCLDPEVFGLDYTDDCLLAGIRDVRDLPFSATLRLIDHERHAAA